MARSPRFGARARRRRSPVGLALASILLSSAARAGEAPADGRWWVTLAGAERYGIPVNDAGPADPAPGASPAPGAPARKAKLTPRVDDLDLVLKRRDGRWVPLFSSSERLFGLVESETPSGALRLAALKDSTNRGNSLGRVLFSTWLARYDVQLTCAPDGTLSGSWAGSAGKGAVSGRRWPLPKLPAGPAAPGRAPALPPAGRRHPCHQGQGGDPLGPVDAQAPRSAGLVAQRRGGRLGPPVPPHRR